jgi:predicted nucleic acid-binding protein
MKYLLDVSTVVACLWHNHVFHGRARAWLEGKELAVCPITELGFLRVSVAAHGADLPHAREMLQSFLDKYRPAFVPCDLRALAGRKTTLGSKTTDFYLASLAEKNGMHWATLDEHIKHPAAFVLPA